MKLNQTGNKEAMIFRLRLKVILLFLIAILVTTAAQAQCPTPPGNPSAYSTDQWTHYVYSGLDSNNPPQNAFGGSMTYRGYYVTASDTFHNDFGNASISGATICGSYADSFAVRSRMRKTFTPGWYLVTIGGDDGVRLSTNGGSSWDISDWNYHTYQTASAVLYLSGSMDLVMESYDQGGQYNISFNYTACPNPPSSAPTGISGPSAVCGSTSVTLTATGATLSGSGTYQWGTGSVGNNIIAGATGATLTTTVSATTTYWVRCVDTGICAQTTAAATRQIAFSNAATAPTSITGTTSICLGGSTTLTASGGSNVTGSSFEWGTGSVVGNNILSGQNAQSITVAPTTNTTYWVRRVSPNSCGATAGVTQTVTVNEPPGDQVSYGSGQWVGYVYSAFATAAPPTDAFTAPYRGYQTQSEFFDQNLGGGSISGANICGSYANQFAIRYKMRRNLPAGIYTFTVGGDDGFRLSINGGGSWIIDNWAEHSYTTASSAAITHPGGNIDFVLEYYENAGDSRISFTYSSCSTTAPTALNVSNACTPDGSNLWVSGGNGNTYQWGTGTTPGSNIIGGQTGSSYYASPAQTTTYWVRRYDATCNYYTDAVFGTLTKTGTGPWNVSASPTTTCAGGTVTLTANPGTMPTGSLYQWGTGSVAGNNVLGTSSSNTRNVTVNGTTTFWVRVINGGSCPAGNAQFVTVNNTALSTAPSSMTGDNNMCNSNGINIYANGGSHANGAQYQWGTGTVIGSNVLGLTSGNSYNVNPNVTTTYWVRRYDATCNNYTGGVTGTVYKGGSGPWNINGPWMVCAGSSVTLTADGTQGGGTYQWGTGSVGNNIISGASSQSITVTAGSSNQTYWVRLVGAGTCNTSSATYNLQVYTPSTTPTSISGNATLCNGSGQNLSANGISFGNAGGQYQWGTGSVVGTNPIANSNSQTLWVAPAATTTYWVRAYDSTCNNYTSGVTFTVNVSSTAPSAVSSSATTICSGNSVTLTASGGYHAPGATYQWGTGGTAGNNQISGDTASITVSPTSTTTYWVRRSGSGSCGATSAQYITVNVNAASVAPSSVTASATTVCPGSSVTLTATGGSGSSTFQWGTGTTPGTGTISGQTGSTLTRTLTATTTYWVRRVDPSPCGPTAAAFVTVTVDGAPGDPSVFGSNTWNVYGYNGNSADLNNVTYRGYYVQNTLNPNTQDMANNGWNNQTSPSASAGWNGCSVNNDSHTFVYKREGFPCGTYNLIANNWDDAIRVYVDGNLVYFQNGWSGGNVTNLVGSYNLTSTSTIEIRVGENGSASNMAMTLTKTDVASQNMVSLTASSSTFCPGSSITLAANGGTKGTNAVYQWGTGAIGSNILGTTATNTFSVQPTANTTYWVRFYDSLCGTTTAGRTRSIAMSGVPVVGTLSNPTTEICRNSTPVSGIILSGNSGSVVKWQYASDAAFSVGVTDINVTTTTLSPAQIGPVPATRWFRAVVTNGCNQSNTAAVVITVPSAVTYDNGSWSATPTATTPVIISSNLNLTSNLTVCACEVTGTATVTIDGAASLIVQREVVVADEATFIIENSGSLVQVEDDAVDIGNVRVKRNTTRMRTYDFSYWSSPVQGFTLNALSPNTLSDKYYAFNPSIGNWQTISGGNQAMAAGSGYIVRAPQGWSLTNASNGVYTAQFNGVPNTGTIPVSIQKSTSPYNLIGNPYPSAIDIDLFITDAVNSGVVNGTVYLWSHNTPLNPAGGVYTYTTNDYAKYNLTGGVKTASSAVTGGAQPTGKIASGQGFFIEAATSLPNGNYTAYFRNSMRVANQNNQFFRVAEQIEAQPEAPQLEKHRYWVKLTNNSGAYDETLVGYVSGATNAKDPLYDGTTFPAGNAASIYTILGADKLAINGRTLPFDNQDVVPLGFKVTVAGEFRISLEQFDGLFGNQDIFLLDKTTNLYHNLKASDFVFTTVTGQFDERFELHYVDQALSSGDHQLENDVIVIKNGDHIEISSSLQPMEAVTLYDVTGKRVYEKTEVNHTLFVSDPLHLATQVLIVKIKLANESVVTRKIRF